MYLYVHCLYVYVCVCVCKYRFTILSVSVRILKVKVSVCCLCVYVCISKCLSSNICVCVFMIVCFVCPQIENVFVNKCQCLPCIRLFSSTYYLKYYFDKCLEFRQFRYYVDCFSKMELTTDRLYEAHAVGHRREPIAAN